MMCLGEISLVFILLGVHSSTLEQFQSLLTLSQLLCLKDGLQGTTWVVVDTPTK